MVRPLNGLLRTPCFPRFLVNPLPLRQEAGGYKTNGKALHPNPAFAATRSTPATAIPAALVPTPISTGMNLGPEAGARHRSTSAIAAGPD